MVNKPLVITSKLKVPPSASLLEAYILFIEISPSVLLMDIAEPNIVA